MFRKTAVVAACVLGVLLNGCVGSEDADILGTKMDEVKVKPGGTEKMGRILVSPVENLDYFPYRLQIQSGSVLQPNVASDRLVPGKYCVIITASLYTGSWWSYSVCDILVEPGKTTRIPLAALRVQPADPNSAVQLPRPTYSFTIASGAANYPFQLSVATEKYLPVPADTYSVSSTFFPNASTSLAEADTKVESSFTKKLKGEEVWDLTDFKIPQMATGSIAVDFEKAEFPFAGWNQCTYLSLEAKYRNNGPAVSIGSLQLAEGKVVNALATQASAAHLTYVASLNGVTKKFKLAANKSAAVHVHRIDVDDPTITDEAGEVTTTDGEYTVKRKLPDGSYQALDCGGTVVTGTGINVLAGEYQVETTWKTKTGTQKDVANLVITD